ncbi:uncharacterized protein BX664DRAFT_376295 [Halteromyces radiatus]|uniref:uncharacterized protein n=1 Tax=Halteromyces radiatus TaxID=101107 RepID=UPI00221FD7BC|nr:uncharacterized protein BX664DRAFT_376295 [Halteromyces radiatus]KAI8081632.1 hypothetical protein BX664DRAFT_376295 [Halteromyces radiatus]
MRYKDDNVSELTMVSKTKQKNHDITPPNQAYTRHQAYDTDTNSLDSSVWSPTNTVVENMSSAATLSSKDEKTSLDKASSSLATTPVTSGWLYQRQRNSKWNRAMLSCVGLVVFLVLMGTVVLWVGSAFILPQNKYSATLAQVPRSSSYSFGHHSATIHPTKTKPTSAVTTHPSSSSSTTTTKRSRQRHHHHKYDDDGDDDD